MITVDQLAELISDATCGDTTPWSPQQEALILKALRELWGLKETMTEPYRVFCDKHDAHRARYTNGRPLMDDRCPWCVALDYQRQLDGFKKRLPCDQI